MSDAKREFTAAEIDKEIFKMFRAGDQLPAGRRKEIGESFGFIGEAWEERVRQYESKHVHVAKTQAPIGFEFHNAAEKRVIPKVKFIVDQIIPEGALVGFLAKPKMGKTTFIKDMIDAIRRGTPFLRYRVEPCSVVYVSEQGLTSFTVEANNSGLLILEGEQLEFGGGKMPDFCYATAEDWYKTSWPDIVKVTEDCTARIGAKIAVFDTISKIARVEDENSASEMQSAISRLMPLQAALVSPVIVQHERKASGEIYDSGRGSNAILGCVDSMFRISLVDAKKQPTYRELEYVGRFPGPSVPLIINRRTTDSSSRYELIGNRQEVRAADKDVLAPDRILQVFKSGGDYTIAEIMEETNFPKTTVFDAVKKLTTGRNAPLMVKGGNGTKEEPYIYGTPF